MNRKSLSVQTSNLDIKLLRTFKTVVECKGLAASETELNIGRSAISRLISELEDKLSMNLCKRGRSGFQITEQGKQVYNATLELLLDLEKFRSNVNTISSHLTGELVLGLTDNMITVPNSSISSILGEFHRQEKCVKISLEVAAPNIIERAVIEGRVHIGVVPHHHHLPGLDYHHLHKEQSKLYCGVRHPLFTMSPDHITADELRNFDFIAPGYVHSILVKERFPEVKTTATSFQAEGIATLILSGQYIGFLPCHYANLWVEKQLMRPILPSIFQYEIPFKAISRRDSQPNLLRSAFLQVLCGVQPLNVSKKETSTHPN